MMQTLGGRNGKFIGSGYALVFRLEVPGDLQYAHAKTDEEDDFISSWYPQFPNHWDG